ncbi:MAG TPA: hypothetical protein ENJ27_00060 [Candidatus Moranbacteria bacterium]|nr:hypothetical protein [Candidatus Moranbacteria bacterium]
MQDLKKITPKAMDILKRQIKELSEDEKVGDDTETKISNNNVEEIIVPVNIFILTGERNCEYLKRATKQWLDNFKK